jgi:hypothetical protein
MALSSIGGSGSGVTATFNNRFDWAVGVNYKAGDVATVVGIRQVCRIDHLSGASPDLSKWTPTEGTDGFSTTAASVMTVAAAKPTSVGIHVFLVTPTDGLPSGVSLKDLAYYDSTTWSVFRTYASAPSTFRVGDVEWYKFKGGWTFDVPWATYVPAITGSTTNPTLATTKTLLSRQKVEEDTLYLAFTYYAASATGATAGSGAYMIDLPSGLRIDTAVAQLATTVSSSIGNTAGVDGSMLGAAILAITGGSSIQGAVIGAASTKVGIHVTTSTTGTAINTMWGNATSPLTSSGLTVKFTAEIPIKRIWEA